MVQIALYASKKLLKSWAYGAKQFIKLPPGLVFSKTDSNAGSRVVVTVRTDYPDEPTPTTKISIETFQLGTTWIPAWTSCSEDGNRKREL